MSAHNEHFPWSSYHRHYNFFEGIITNHGRIATLDAKDVPVYEITRTDGDVLRVFICECYAFGVAEYMETVEKLGPVDAVIINSVWCGYSLDAKRHCQEQRVGLFKIREFMAALNREDYWNYLAEDEKEYFKKQGWL